MQHTAARLRSTLRELADPARRASQQRFSREPIRSLGIHTPEIRRLAVAAAREYRREGVPLSEVSRSPKGSGAAGSWKSESWPSSC